MLRGTFLFFAIIISTSLSAQTVATIAGNGILSCDYSSGLAINKSISSPIGIAIDDFGNKYIADGDCHVIWKLGSGGIISTYVGNGNIGNSGDGNLAINAEINKAYGVCLDKSGNLYFSDFENGNIRKVNVATGIINNIASGFVNPMHITCNSFGDIFVVDGSDIIKKINSQTHLVENFIYAPNQVVAIAVDINDNFYYSTQNGKIFFYNQPLNSSELIAGTGNTSYNGENIDALSANINCAYDLCFDNDGNLVFVDTYNYRIRRINKSNNKINTILGDGTNIMQGNGISALATGFVSCKGFCIDECNHLYFTDNLAHVVRKSEIQYVAPDIPILSVDNYCVGSEVTINIQGNLNDAETWALYSYGCGSILKATSTSNSISFTPSISDTYYVRGNGQCVPVGACGTINIALANQPYFLVNPTGTTLCSGQAHTMNVDAIGGIGTISFYWQESDDGINFFNINGANSSNYTTPILTTTKYYRCKIESMGLGCNASYSSVAVVNVTPVPANNLCVNAEIINSLPFNSGLRNNNCAGNNAPVNSGCNGYGNNVWFKIQGNGFKMKATTESVLTNFDTEIHVYSGTCGNLQEVICNDNYQTNTFSVVEWCSIAGETYFISVGSSEVSGITGNFVLSVTDYPLTPPVISQSSFQACVGGSVNISASMGDNGNIIKWYAGSCGSSVIAIGSSFNYIVQESTYIYARTFNSECPNAMSNCSYTYITAYDNISITNQLNDKIICSGGNHDMEVSAIGGIPQLSYQWQYSTNGQSFQNIIGETLDSVYVANITAPTYYRCRVNSNNPSCVTVYSDTVFVDMVPDISFSFVPQGAIICSGDFYEMNVETTGGTPAVNIQWQYSSGFFEWNDIPDANENTFLAGPFTQSAFYRVIASASGSGCETVYSNIISVIVDDSEAPVPNIVNLPEIVGECSVEITEFPTATDNCEGQIIATTDDELSYDEAGQYLIIWTYTDSKGNSSQQFQWVIVDDNLAPVPDVNELPEIFGECEAEITQIPTATDNCDGTIIATTNSPLFFNEQGTHYVLWKFTDAAGNSTNQIQTIKVIDTTPPEITCSVNAEVEAVPNHYYFVSGIQFDPYEFSDNCNIAEITNSFNNSSSLYGAFLPEGLNVITWTIYDDNSNLSTCTINILVNSWVGIEKDNLRSLNIYPNPGTGVFYIEMYDSSEVTCLKLFNILGELLFDNHAVVVDNKIEMNLSGYQKGNYFVQIETSNKVFIETLILE